MTDKERLEELGWLSPSQAAAALVSLNTAVGIIGRLEAEVPPEVNHDPELIEELGDLSEKQPNKE
jgi:hypothetical protein